MPVIFEEVALQSVGSETSGDDDRWPRFTLNSVTVLSESTKELVSMFSAHKNHAVCVVGYLQEIPESHAHLGIYPLHLPPLSVKFGFGSQRNIGNKKKSRTGFIQRVIILLMYSHSA